MCSSVEINDSEIRGNVQCGVKVLAGASLLMKKCRVNSNEGYGVRVGAKCPADLMQNGEREAAGEARSCPRYTF